jgi:hypothetical protein
LEGLNSSKYAEAIGAVKACTTLSASTSALILILGGMSFLTAMAVLLFFPGSDQFDKSGTLELRTSYEVLDVSLKREPHLYVSLAAVY